MEYENIITWDDLKEYAGTNYPEAHKILEEAHKEAEIISSIMDKLNKNQKFISRKNFKYNSTAKSRKMRAHSSRLQRV